MATFMLTNPSAAAASELNGSNIYINGSLINGMSTADQQGLLLHELLHNITGMVAGDIQTALGLPTNKASQNIGDKLKGDCFQ